MNEIDALVRKKVSVIAKYARENFSHSDWHTFGQIIGRLKDITDHPRLLRALSFGDDDYEACILEVLNKVLSESPIAVEEVIDHFDIGLWYQQKDPARYKKLFLGTTNQVPDFWTAGKLRLFISHLSSNRERMSQLKSALGRWGITGFVAHQDIEPTREWRDEVEAALETMDVMAALVEPGFKESDWCCQEVGYALGRRIEILPLRAGLDPFGFFGKFQGINVKGKVPSEVAEAIVSLLLKKPKYREGLLQGIGRAFTTLPSSTKLDSFRKLSGWGVITDEQMRSILEQASLSDHEKSQLRDLITRVGAFKSAPKASDSSEDVPF